MVKINFTFKTDPRKMSSEVIDQIEDKINNNVIPKVAEKIKNDSDGVIDPHIIHSDNNWTLATFNPNDVDIENKNKVFERAWQSIPSIISDSFK